MLVDELQTPALVVERSTLEANLARMARAHPGPRLRPHVKAFKSTDLARWVSEAGHPGFCCATPAEVIGLANAGLGDDLLLANETVDALRLRAMVDTGARITVAVDSDATIDAAAANGITSVLVDVNVGLPRCGCAPEDAGRLAERARAAGLDVRGVMGYEGHAVAETNASARQPIVDESMAILAAAHDVVGGDVVSGGATLTWDTNTTVTELQAGSFLLMDTAFDPLVPFGVALSVVSTVISVSTEHAVCDAGLKSLSVDHGPPTIPGATVWFCSDEHITFSGRSVRVGDRIQVLPSHVDPTVALHDRLHIVDGNEVVDVWPVDLRGW